MVRKTVAVAALTILLSGCVRQGGYRRPVPPVPAAWPAASTDLKGPSAASLKWQEFFNDRGLQAVIGMALANNRDLRIAALSVAKVEAQYRIRRADQFPTLSLASSRDLYRLPRRMSPTGDRQIVEQDVNLGSVAWELDFFGRVRSLKSVALEQYLASEQARSATQIGLVAAVAHSYLSMAADRDNLWLAQQTLDTHKATYDLVVRMRNAGMASDLELAQVQSQVEAARADIARFSGQVELDENALNLLVGATVPADLLPSKLDAIGPLTEIGAGVPSEVLLRRPDVLSAEHQLQAAYANIGVARAAFFPRIALTAGAGFMSSDLADLYKFGARTWNFAPQLTLPIFDTGARQAGLRVAQATRDVAIADYERSIQTAFREVSDALTRRTRLLEQEDAQHLLVNTLDQTYRLSQARYKAGIDSYLSVLVAQRSLYSAQQVLVSLRAARLGNLVTLYKVLGGGA